MTGSCIKGGYFVWNINILLRIQVPNKWKAQAASVNGKNSVYFQPFDRDRVDARQRFCIHHISVRTGGTSNSPGKA